MDIEQRMRRTATHEALHCLFAMSQGMEVESVAIYPRWQGCYGQTTVVWPLAAHDLWWEYRKAPLQTLAQLRAVIGTLLAPHEIDGGTHYATSSDRAVLATWRKHWRFSAPFTTPAGPDWHVLCGEARQAVTAWYWTPGAREQHRALVLALVQYGTVDGAQMQRIVQRYRLNPLKYYRGSDPVYALALAQ